MTANDPAAPPRRRRTRLVHSGREPSEQFGFVNTPIYRGSTVLFPTLDALEGGRQRFGYGRRGSPTYAALEAAWSDLAGAAATVLTPSGLSAVTLALLTATEAGGHVLVSDGVYAPSRAFCDATLKRLGVETTYFDPLDLAGLERLFRPGTKALLIEAPSSQTFEMPDAPAIFALARGHGVASIIDNTWATPLFFPPHARGADLAVEAGTKYLGGHSDILLGLVSANADWAKRLHATHVSLGLCAGAEDVFLALRGLRTLDLRLREAERQGFALATWLAGRPEVSRVLHPGLPGDPGHAIWKRDFAGASSLFSVVLKPAPRAALAAMLDRLELFGMGYSWGGFESLVVPFDAAKNRTATRWAPEGPCLRFTVGMEDVEDLKEDLDGGFARLAAAR